MKVLVCGSTGCIGSAVARALRSRGHQVLGTARGDISNSTSHNTSHSGGLHVDFMTPVTPEAWAQRLHERQIDAVVNCVGMLMPRQGQSFERVHAQGPIELFRGAALAGVQRVVQVSALGAGEDAGEDAGGVAGGVANNHAASITSPYLRSKRKADDALLALPLHATVLRPSLVFGPGSASTTLFATLAALPVVSLPGGGQQQLRPIHVYEVAEIITRCLERAAAVRGVYEIGGADVVSYRQMLATYRQALGASLAPPLWLPLPMALMQASAWAAETLPQQVFCRETLALLERGNVPAHNAAGALLGRAPTGLAAGLAISPPLPAIDLRVQLSPVAAGLLRATLAFMWLWTAAVSALWPESSGVLALLARCGLEGDAGLVMLVVSCALNVALGLLTLWRPGPRLYAVQLAAIVGYSSVAALNMPELLLDHCGALVKNLPLAVAVLLLWLGAPGPGQAKGHAALPAGNKAYNTAG